MSKAISYMLAFLTAGILLSCNENKYTEEDVESADGLEVLTDDFAKDSLQAYYHKLPIPGSDPATFVALDKAYAKDKNNVYFCIDDSYLNHWPFTWEPSKERRKVEVIDSTESASFISLGQGYAKGTSKVFLDGKRIRVRDVKSFRVLIKNIAVDDKQAYVAGKAIKGSDGRTFVLISESDTACCGIYARDSKSIYYVIKDEAYYIPSVGRAFRILGNSFAQDDKFVFYKNKKLADADPASFRLLDEHFSTDGKFVFYHETKIRNADPLTFKILQFKVSGTHYNSAYSTDGRSVFWESSVIRDADPNTFSIVDETTDHGKDKNHIFFHERIIEGDPKTFDASMVVNR